MKRMLGGRAVLVFAAVLGSTMCAVGCDGGQAAAPPAVVDRALLASYSATWDGYVEAFMFRSGTDRVRIQLDEQGNGWLQVGDGDPLSPPTNPDVGYPEQAGVQATSLNLYDHIRYPVIGARVQAERLRFSFDSFAGAYGDWCALQKPVLQFNVQPAPQYGCTAEGTAHFMDPDGICRTRDTPTGELHPIDCMKLILCNSACECDAQKCAVVSTAPPFLVDAALSDDGRHLEGTLLIPDWSAPASPRTLRLVKAAP